MLSITSIFPTWHVDSTLVSLDGRTLLMNRKSEYFDVSMTGTDATVKSSMQVHDILFAPRDL